MVSWKRVVSQDQVVQYLCSDPGPPHSGTQCSLREPQGQGSESFLGSELREGRAQGGQEAQAPHTCPVGLLFCTLVRS